MYNLEARVADLTRVVEALMECFVDAGDHWEVFTSDGLVKLDSDLESNLEQAYAVLYEDEGDEEDSEFDR